MIELILPHPPSVNKYYRRVGVQTKISKAGRLYRVAVMGQVRVMGIETLVGPLRCSISVFPPDRRRRDLDNILKALLDALEHSGLYVNDFQISDLRVQRREPLRPDGQVIVNIEELEPRKVN